MKKALVWSRYDIAQFLGAENGNSVKSSFAVKIPAFAKLMICVFENSQKRGGQRFENRKIRVNMLHPSNPRCITFAPYVRRYSIIAR